MNMKKPKPVSATWIWVIAALLRLCECAFWFRQATKETNWIRSGKRGSARKCGDEKHGERSVVRERHRHG